MEDIGQMFANFFAQKQKFSLTIASQQRNASRVTGYLNEYRAREFAHIRQSEQLGGPLWARLSGKVYRLTQDWLYVVVAHYDDGTILWLDDHLDDADFSGFVQRERLAEWLPDHLNEILELLLETKFYFLGWPQLIHSVSDIPLIPERYTSHLTDPKDDYLLSSLDQQKALESLREADRRLASVADQIRAPESIRLEDGSTRLIFYIWTKILGKVVRLDTYFGVDNSFKYEAAQLTEQVGYFTVPR